jgi:hypothetical protein
MRGGRGAALAAAIVLLVAIFVVARQPVGGPWWLNADPDATYAASSLNLLRGDHTRYFGHPGLPEQELLALTFASQHLLQRLDGSGPPSVRDFVDSRLTDLDRTRSVFRGWAIVLFVGGALVVFGLTARLLGNTWWGLLAGLMWVAAPDFASGSIQIRPDVALSLLCFATLYLAARGAQRRDALAYLGAAALLGFAVTVKLHAIGLAPALVLATAIRPPHAGWRADARDRVANFAARGWRALVVTIAAWVVLVIVLNWHRIPFSPTASQWRAVVIPIVVVATWFVVASRLSRRSGWRVVDPFFPLLAAAALFGIAVPLTLYLPEGFHAAAEIWNGLSGGGAQQGIPLFTLDWKTFEGFPLKQALVLFVLGGFGALVGLRRRSLTPLLWFVAAAVMGVMGAARLGALRYFEPAYVLSIPAALWPFARARSATAPVAAALLTAYIVYPSLHNARGPSLQADRDRHYSALAEDTANRVLGPSDVAIAPDYAPIADVRYWAVVQNFVDYTPAYPYRFLPDYAPALPTAERLGKQVRFYFGPAAIGLVQPGTLTLASGTWSATPVPEASTPEFAVVRITPG